MALMPGEGKGRSGKRRLVRTLSAVMLASSALILANGSVPGMAQAHAATEAPVPWAVTVPAQANYRQLALDTLDEVVQGDFAAVSARFDESIRQQVSPELLATSWKDYQAAFGRYQAHGGPRQVASRSGVVVDVPLRMAKHPGEFRVTFNKDGHIIGLYFLRTGVPVP